MAVVVQKYGGSSLADADGLRGIAQHVVARRRAGSQLVVVVSAMGRSTNALIAQARALARQPPHRELDMLVTAGERIAMALLSMAIEDAGVPAISFTGSQSGIITDSRHQGARILEVRPQRIQAALAAGRVVIVAGYQGVSAAREVTTLGRGGSDTTAVALAAALGAEACEIYSDVDGVYTADPRICPQARHLAEISYEAMGAMAVAGARVLNAAAVDYARRAGIEIAARATRDPGGRETRVHAAAPASAAALAVVGAGDLALGTGAALTPPLCAALVALGAELRAAGPGAMLWDCVGVPGRDVAAVIAAAAAHGAALRPVGSVTVVGGQPAAALALLQEAAAPPGGPTAAFAGPGWVALALPPAAVDSCVRAAHGALSPPSGA